MTRTAKILAAALLVSVALNVAIGGFLVGRAFDRTPGRVAVYRMFLGALGPGVPAPVREAMRTQFDAVRPTMRPAIAEMRAARRAVGDRLQADSIDRVALEDALARLRGATNAAQTVLHGAFADAVVAFAADDRQALARAWQRGPRRGAPHHR